MGPQPFPASQDLFPPKRDTGGLWGQKLPFQLLPGPQPWQLPSPHSCPTTCLAALSCHGKQKALREEGSAPLHPAAGKLRQDSTTLVPRHCTSHQVTLPRRDLSDSPRLSVALPKNTCPAPSTLYSLPTHLQSPFCAAALALTW